MPLAGVVFIIILPLMAGSEAGRHSGRHITHQRGSSLPSSTHPWHSYTLNTFTWNALPGYGEGPGHRRFHPSYAWNWGPHELAYGYVPVASTPVESLQAWWHWRQGVMGGGGAHLSAVGNTGGSTSCENSATSVWSWILIFVILVSIALICPCTIQPYSY